MPCHTHKRFHCHRSRATKDPVDNKRFVYRKNDPLFDSKKESEKKSISFKQWPIRLGIEKIHALQNAQVSSDLLSEQIFVIFCAIEQYFSKKNDIFHNEKEILNK